MNIKKKALGNTIHLLFMCYFYSHMHTDILYMVRLCGVGGEWMHVEYLLFSLLILSYIPSGEILLQDFASKDL